MIKPYGGAFPKLHPTVFVAESAQVIGDVTIGEDSSVWFQTVVRGDVNFIRIGVRTNVQDGCVLHVTRGTHSLMIGDEVTVGHRVVLHGCTVKNRGLVGIGAIVLDGAVVEEDSMVGAGSLVPPGFRVPSGTLVMGVPARVKRELTPEEVKHIKQSASNYVEYSKNNKIAPN
ncbi:MAG: gamma carbonic anhydrase family protein [Thermodesulfobacteriota bacterium]|jgi:carbonic anhydrase/acetyltransferase-like protein (isoleucine patch superfamily)